jgi:dCTP deaminase
MGVLSDGQIRARCLLPETDPMHMRIVPFAEATKLEGQVSFGLSHYGLDLRLGRNYRLFNDLFITEIDPHTMFSNIAERLKKGQFVDYKDVDYCVIPPNSFCLAETQEFVRVPRDCFGQITGKSTYARCGIGLTTTPIEPEWYGIITLEIPNHSRLPARIWSNEGIGQIYFIRGDEVCEKSYADKGHSQYQNQKGLTMPSV